MIIFLKDIAISLFPKEISTKLKTPLVNLILTSIKKYLAKILKKVVIGFNPTTQAFLHHIEILIMSDIHSFK